MASDNQTHYGRIGFVILAGLAGVLFALIYLAGFRNARDEVMAETYFDCPVNGLSRGSPVNFRGVKIGEVRDIEILLASDDMADLQTIRVVMAINRRLMGLGDEENAERRFEEARKLGLHAELDSNLVTGISRIELLYPRHPIVDRKISWKPKYPQVPPAASMVDALTESLRKMSSKLDEVNFAGAWSNVQIVAENAARITGRVDELLDVRSAGVSETVENLRELTGNLKELSERLKNNPSLLLRENDPLPLTETVR